MTAPVTMDIDEHVAVVTLNRAAKNNALTLEMLATLTETGRSLASNRQVRAVVLRGAGDHFCAGIDTAVFSEAPDRLLRRMRPAADSPANEFQRPVLVWRELPMPVIAAVSGVAYGAGLQLAMAADVRFGADDARLSVMEIRWGIIPDMALSVTMRHLVPLDRLKELVFTGRIVDAKEAGSLGLLSAVVADPVAAAQRLASGIAGRSPDAVRAAKLLLNSAFDAPVANALGREAELQLSLLGTPNQQEAVAANVEKRPPRFRDPPAPPGSEP